MRPRSFAPTPPSRTGLTLSATPRGYTSSEATSSDTTIPPCDPSFRCTDPSPASPLSRTVTSTRMCAARLTNSFLLARTTTSSKSDLRKQTITRILLKSRNILSSVCTLRTCKTNDPMTSTPFMPNASLRCSPWSRSRQMLTRWSFQSSPSGSVHILTGAMTTS
eukprot:Rmarinus@m.25904